MAKALSIAIFASYPNHYCDDAFRGIAGYNRRFGSFQWLLSQGGDFDPLDRRQLRDIHGVILLDGPDDGFLADRPWRRQVPVVSLAQIGSAATRWQVLPDNAAVGRMVAEEFLRRGFKELAYCPIYNQPWDQHRRDAFAAAATAGGGRVSVYPHRWSEKWGQFPREWTGHLAEWLTSLPKPIGIMAATDLRGRHLLLAAQIAGVKVPEEAAVIGVDNFPWGELCPASLSSVELDGYRAGYVAAQMLHRLVEGESPEHGVAQVPPRRLITRQSSDVLAIDDLDVIHAAHFIAQHATSGINVQRVVGAVPLSRRALERRFQQFLHCSILDKIRSVQIDRAKILLLDQSIPLQRVATLCGLRSAARRWEKSSAESPVSPPPSTDATAPAPNTSPAINDRSISREAQAWWLDKGKDRRLLARVAGPYC